MGNAVIISMVAASVAAHVYSGEQSHEDIVLLPGDQVHAFLRESDEDVLKDCLLCELVRTGEENVLG